MIRCDTLALLTTVFCRFCCARRVLYIIETTILGGIRIPLSPPVFYPHKMRVLNATLRFVLKLCCLFLVGVRKGVYASYRPRKRSLPRKTQGPAQDCSSRQSRFSSATPQVADSKGMILQELPLPKASPAVLPGQANIARRRARALGRKLRTICAR